MKNKALIFGVTGQDGSYLSEILLEKGYEIHGVKRRSSSFNTSRIDHLFKNTDFKLHYGDVTDSLSVTSLIQKIKPKEIYNLSAQSHVKVSFEVPEYTANVDALGTLRILEAIKLLGMESDIRFYQASTSELFGLVQEIPQKETTPFYPRSPYGCFPKGTKVLTKVGGKLKNVSIEKLKIGDEVLSFNEKTHEKEFDKIIDTMVRDNHIFYKIKFSNGNEIECSGEHPFYVFGKGWVEAKDLKINFECVQYNYSGLNTRVYSLSGNLEKRFEGKRGFFGNHSNESKEKMSNSKKGKSPLIEKLKSFYFNTNTEMVSIVSMEKIEKHEPVYNITTENNHNYFAYGILVHNCAKLYGYWIVKNYREAYNIHASNGILFNHESPRRGETFVTKKIVMGLNDILMGKIDCLKLGNLNSLRDWGHAKDYCEAMYLMLQQNKPDDYVIATGEQHSVREFVELAANYIGFNIVWEGEGLDEVGIDTHTGKTIIRIDPNYFRPTEVESLLGDSTKARNILGWKPKISYEDLVYEMVNYELLR